jgi:hypothetical protein
MRFVIIHIESRTIGLTYYIQLVMYLSRTMDDVISEGDTEGLILTGLSTRGMDLLERMVNRYGDVQTAALLVAFVVPRRLQDSRAEEWIER